ncbi:transcriptional regulator [Hyphococcus flavus]|uniref:Transcriptional regulator n=1 Tax=Hyphococcus flavus TaxID=1866326 RepID=A0AAE9ZG54_9PROT|nr:metalloregulator ArsR/SmtB family transcription factor [Hyphococcus flavus]WDI32167.1 transcriptional regulator [Hyphococcus flavus]
MSKISNAKIGKSDKPRKTKANGAEAGATRAAILDMMKREGEQCASHMGPALGITPMAARLQLYALEEEGLVKARSEAQGRGRPLKYWSLTEKAANVFPDAHQSLAVEMIKSVEELFGAEGLAKLVKKHGNMQRAAYGEKLASAKTTAERVKRLAKARSDEGYMAEAKKDGRDWLLIENHCPICSAAKACTGLCAGELKVFSDVLGKDVKVEREEHILAGARRCAYRVRVK